jgi:hypothetical protein
MPCPPLLFSVSLKECSLLGDRLLCSGIRGDLPGSQETTMSNFEPNAVIRGFQLTVVGSMFP